MKTRYTHEVVCNYDKSEAAFIKKCGSFVQSYAESFFSDPDQRVIEAVKMKLEHTEYVQRHARELAIEIGLWGHDVFLAELLGLLHDVGRFRQFQVYKTFFDAQSEDHAKLGIKVINDKGLLDELSETDREIITFSIRNHNQRFIEPTDDERNLLFAKIIRDADKLDIFKVLSPYLEPSDGSGVNQRFVEEFNQGIQCDYSKMETKDDRKIVRLIWVYDINYSWTMKRIAEAGYIDRIIECLMPNEAIKPGIIRLQEYVKKKCNEKGNQKF